MILLLFILSLVVNIFVGYYISSQKGDGKGGYIFDAGFHLLPNWEHYEHLPDYLLLVPIIALIYSWSTWSSSKKNDYLLLLSLMYFARAVCNAVTVMPYTKEQPCKLKPRFAFCNDYTFSGHTTFNIVTSNFVGGPLWPFWPIISSITSVLTRDHYTLDIVLAWIIFFSLKCNIIT
jgi:hypothetical protein